jgi:hypothetical protein
MVFLYVERNNKFDIFNLTKNNYFRFLFFFFNNNNNKKKTTKHPNK